MRGPAGGGAPAGGCDLHFSLHSCGSLPDLPGGGSGCPTIPMNFRNTDPNPTGLVMGRAYRALPF